MNDDRETVFELAASRLEALMGEWGQPAYRARQLYRHLYARAVPGFDAMTDLPAALRQRLEKRFRWSSLELEHVVSCDEAMTRKALMRGAGGVPVESVLMVYPDRATVCVSSQSGCPMGCVFCATAKLGFLSDLTTGQIVEQVLWAEREVRSMRVRLGPDFPRALRARPPTRHALTHVVFMGMGEAFNNYENWWGAVERLHDARGYHMGARNFTVSTVGLVPGILRLADEKLPVNLAISLHAVDDDLRTELMPVNKSYPVDSLLEATREYIRRTHRRVSFEYVLLRERNDAEEQAVALAERLGGLRSAEGGLLCHVNLIPWNPVPGSPLGRSHKKRVTAFQEVLLKRRIPCTVRVERGTQIGAACGQLAGQVTDDTSERIVDEHDETGVGQEQAS